MTKRGVVRAVAAWLPLAVAITILVGLAYGLEQQDLRQGADDPQVQLAEDTAAHLNGGSPLNSVVSSATPRVDIASSLAAFVIVYGRHDDPQASSAVLDNRVPRLPAGVTASARSSGEDRVTWQPRAGVRIAAVVVPFKDGSVLAGRSLRLVEQREDQALLLAVAGWAAAMALSLLAAIAASVVLVRLRGRCAAR